MSLFLIWWWFFSLPAVLFHQPVSTAVYSAENKLLGAQVANDGQWRFEDHPDITDKFAAALISFEDERFYYHPGVDVFAICRAAIQNIRANKVVSGASTISMQVIRLHRIDRPRIWSEKFVEMLLALRLECRYSKAEILALWAAHAPFGGNVVGLEAAAWRYYGRSPDLLSWGEVATLAVLPNAPSIIHPDKNRHRLKVKRDRLLLKLVEDNKIDSLTAQLSTFEPLPERPKAMPQLASHLLANAVAAFPAGRFNTWIDVSLQGTVQAIINRHHVRLSQNEIHNAAALILVVKSQKIVAYVGNTNAGNEHGEQVDIIQAPRSSGSILKPFLYAAMMRSGDLLPKELVFDIPTFVGGYHPKNFHDEYDGAVPADQALSRSLNIPAVRQLRDYGVDKFHRDLRNMHFSTINNPAEHYGLSLILGGAEVTLWELTQNYGAMANVLNQYHENKGRYFEEDWTSMSYLKNKDQPKTQTEIHPVLDAGAIYLTMNALTSVKRPATEFGWEHFADHRKIAWKTGTSIGYRDAWAIGITPEYVVAVWVGNGDGEGRPDLIGVRAAAPLMFDIYKELPSTSWFEAPHDELRRLPVCAISGNKAGPNCLDQQNMEIHKQGRKTLTCSFHKMVVSDSSGQFAVNRSCYPASLIKNKITFELPPTVAHYYQRHHIDYQGPLPYLANCQSATDDHLDIIYPQKNSIIKIPKELSGKRGHAIFEVAHQNQDASVYWHIDDVYMGKTQTNHSLSLQTDPGLHLLTVLDGMGNTNVRQFEVVE